MRVAINARILLAPRTGIGQYVAETVNALQCRDDVDVSLFFGRRWGDTIPKPPSPGRGGHASWLSAVKRNLPGAYPLRRLIEQHVFDAELTRNRVDLYHEPSLWPLDFDGPMVMTLHDLTHVHYPETQPRQRLAEIERRVGKGVASAARILVDSAYIGREVISHFGIKADKVVVAPLGCHTDFHPREAAQTHTTLQALGLTHREYLLCVGTLEPRKNLTLALRAHARLPHALRVRYPLLLVGMSGWGEQQFAAELQAALASGQVRLAGYLDQEKLTQVIASARALVYPSFYEGFGLPVVEAMASGVPVIVSDRASLPEVAGAAGMVVDASDDIGLSEAMHTLIEDAAEWQRRSAAGLIQAAQFTWQRCAEITAQTYRAAIS